MKKITRASAKQAWDQTVEQLASDSPLKFGVMEEFVFDSYTNGVIGIAIPHSVALIKKTLFWPQFIKKVNSVLNEKLKSEVEIYFSIQSTEPIKEKTEQVEPEVNEPIELEINWGWLIKAALYSVIANAILAIATLITLICK